MRTLLIAFSCLTLFSCGDDNPDPAPMNNVEAPTQVTSAVIFGDITSNALTISWTNGDGSGRVVLIKEGSPVDATLANGQGYTASATFGSGDELGTGNFIVFNGSGNTVVVTGLSSNIEYHFAIHEYNGSGADIKYLISSKAESSQTTLADVADAPLTGSWLVGTEVSEESAVITFIDETTYMLVVDGQSDEDGQPGMERGTYTLDPATDSFTGTPIASTIDDWGFSDVAYPATLTISGNSSVFTDQEESTELSKIQLSENNPLVGSWLDTDGVSYLNVLTFIDSVNYMIGTDIATPGDAVPGMERGTYTWDANSGGFTANALRDTNGAGAFSPLLINNLTLTVAQDSLFVSFGGSTGSLSRIK